MFRVMQSGDGENHTESTRTTASTKRGRRSMPWIGSSSKGTAGTRSTGASCPESRSSLLTGHATFIASRFTFAVVGALKFVKTWNKKGWPKHTVYSDSKPLRWNLRHWIEVQPPTEDGQIVELLATNKGNNRIEVTASQVREMSVLLHPRMVDFDKPVVIRVNGTELFNEIVKPQPSLMFNLAREFDDRGRVFWAKVDLKISSDRDVTLPGR